jgi:heptosyltransferase-2
MAQTAPPRPLPEFERILVRATNWVGDAVMCLPALRALRERYRKAQITILARPWVADLYRREPFADAVILLESGRGAKDLAGKWAAARGLRGGGFDCALLLQNAFEAALIAWLARIPVRIGYDRDGRGWLLTHAVAAPKAGELPRHERFYYLELLRRAGILQRLPESGEIRLECADRAREAGLRRYAEMGLEGAVIGVSPGAAFGSAKRWYPERFAEAAARLAGQMGAAVAVFGSGGERALCEEVAAAVGRAGIAVHNFAGETSLSEFIDLAAACRLYLTNDSGAMHIASALQAPTVAVFGATDHIATGPAGAHSSIVREDVECSPCKLRECPIDHRCMTRVTVEQVVEAAQGLMVRKE